MNYIQAIIIFVITSIVALGLHTLSVDAIKLQNKADLKNQAISLQAQCKSDKLLTQEVDYGLQKQNNNTSSSYDTALSVLSDKGCAPSAPGLPSVPNGPTNNNRLYYTDPRAARDLLKRERDAQLQTNRLLSCQAFIKKVWSQQKQ